MDTARFFAAISSSTRWYLVVKLDVPGGRDVSKKIQINVT